MNGSNTNQNSNITERIVNTGTVVKPKPFLCTECGGKFSTTGSDYKSSYKLHKSSRRHKRWKKTQTHEKVFQIGNEDANFPIDDGENELFLKNYSPILEKSYSVLNSSQHEMLSTHLSYKDNKFYCAKCEYFLKPPEVLVHFKNVDHNDYSEMNPVLKYYNSLKLELEELHSHAEFEKELNPFIHSRCLKTELKPLQHRIIKSSINFVNDEIISDRGIPPNPGNNKYDFLLGKVEIPEIIHNENDIDCKDNNYQQLIGIENSVNKFERPKYKDNNQNFEEIFDFHKLLESRNKHMWWII